VIPIGVPIAGIVVGIAIGCVGIGGVLLVPFLTYAAGLDVRDAVAVALASYLPSGLLATWLYARRGSIPWRAALPLTLAALPAALLGALAAEHAPGALLEAAIGTLLLAGGLNALWARGGGGLEGRPLGSVHVAGLGLATGFLSALTGAGGAFVLLPLLLLLGQPALPSIGLGQAIQVPIAGVASAANLTAGRIDLGLAAILAVSLGTGIALGAPIAHALPQAHLRRLVGVVVVLAGAGMLARVAWRVASGAP